MGFALYTIIIFNLTGLTRSNSQLVPPTPPPMPKLASISGSKREKNSHDNQGELTWSWDVIWSNNSFSFQLNQIFFRSNFSLFVFICSVSGRRLSLVLHFPYWQRRVGIWTLGGQHYLGWPGDGSLAYATCTYTGSQRWEYHSRYIQKNIVRLHVLLCTPFYKMPSYPQLILDTS